MIYFVSDHHHHHLYPTMTKTLEIELRSAEGLKMNRKPVKRKTFGVVRIDEKSRRTDLDELGSEGRNNPTWNYKTEMEMNRNVRFIFIEVLYRTGSGREKKIGEAKIPVNDFTGRCSSPEGYYNFLSYRLRDEYGDKCGIVNVSIIVKKTNSVETNSSSSSSCSSQATETGLWRPRSENSTEIGGYGGRIVTGVPIWWPK